MESENVTCILKKLESTSNNEEKLELYQQISSHLKEDDLSIFSIDLANNAKQLWHILERDLALGNVELCQLGLQILGYSLNDLDSVSHLSQEECKSAISTLCQCIQKTEDKLTCTRALWCLNRQNIPADVVRKEVHPVLKAVEHSFGKWKSQSTVENEASNVVYRLLEQCPKDTRQHAVQWGKLILPLLVHGAVIIREKAFETVKKELSTLACNQKELGSWLSAEFKPRIFPEMKKILSAHTNYVLQVWEIYVQISGKELHRGGYINAMLPIVEHGFKNSETRSQAFQAWQQLINNFATNPEILTDQRRVKLIMQVFKASNAKLEDIAKVKLQVWWHFVWLLGAKASAYFEQVCIPLLNFCVGGEKRSNPVVNTPRATVLQNGASPITPRLNLPGSGGQSKSQQPSFQSIQLKGCEILVHFLGHPKVEKDLPSYTFTMDSLNHDIITGPAFFIKHANFLVATTTDFTSSLGENLPDPLLFRLWYSLIAHMKNGLENSVKGEMREAFTSLLTQFQILTLSQALPHKTVLGMFEALCCLPKKALCSTGYNVSNGEKMHGTPALFLTELLLTPSLLKPCSGMERYITLFKTLISTCVNTSGTLGFCQSVLQLLDRNAEFVDNAETLWRLWSEVTNPLHDYINQTSEVNQGDALEHNFGCMYAVLTFPLTNGLPCKLPQPSAKTLLKTWTEVYSSFARLSALVTNAEANICCEDLYHTLLKKIKKEDLKDSSMLDFMFQASAVTANNVDFSSLGNSGAFNINGLSPAKWKKFKQKPMENIQSFTVMLSQLLTTLVEELEGDGHTSSEKKSSSTSLQGAANSALEVFSSIFLHLTASNVLSNVIGQLAEPIGEFYLAGAKKLSSKIFNNAYMQKMEKLWSEICTSIQTRYKGQFDSDFLLKASPLLESTFLHPRRGIKNQTTALWSSTFSKANHLVYPEKIKPVLLKVKDKTSIILPGWISSDIPVIEETPVSQMSQAESQVPEPHIPGMPSPHKIHGSFLNKAVSPNIKKSPAKKAESKSASKAKKDLLGDLKNDDFVVIKTPPKKKMVLTEHQKEMFKEKRAIPALYNTLDASQDVSLMSQFTSDTQQETPTPTPTPTTEPQNPIWILSQSQNSVGDKSTEDKAASDNTEKGSSQASTDSKGPGRKARRSLSGSSSTNGESKPATRRSVRFSIESNDGKEASSQDFANIWDSTKEGLRSMTGRSLRSSPSKKDKDLTSSQEKFCDIWDVVSKDGPSGDDVAVCGGIDHFKVIKDTIIQDGNIDSTSGKSSTDTASGKSSVDTASGKSTSSSAVEAPQNQLEAVRFDPLVKSSSSSDKSTLQCSAETNSEEKDKFDSENSQPLLKWTKQLEELSQSSPARSRSPKRLSSQEKPASPRASKSPRRLTSPRKGKTEATIKGGKGSLDDWLIKSPQKPLSQGSDSDSIIPSSQESVASLVEETQSPTKFSKVGTSKENLPPILETPPRPEFMSVDNSNSEGARGSSRKLFVKDSSKQIEDVVEDSNIIPASPTHGAKSGVKLATPVIKIKRLTQEEILLYSPSRKDSSADEPKTVKCILSSQDDTSMHSVHEHDDFSDVKPLDNEKANNETEQPNSQGFETGEEEPGKSASSVASEPCPNENVNSEVLFTQAESEMESEPYDPGLVSTFRSKSEAKNAQVFTTDNLKSSQSSESSTSSSSQVIPDKEEATAKTYNPSLEQTLASDTPRRGRKRKQETPKKLSPESTRPKRTRKSKDTVSSQESEAESTSKKSRTRKGEKQIPIRKDTTPIKNVLPSEKSALKEFSQDKIADKKLSDKKNDDSELRSQDDSSGLVKSTLDSNSTVMNSDRGAKEEENYRNDVACSQGIESTAKLENKSRDTDSVDGNTLGRRLIENSEKEKDNRDEQNKLHVDKSKLEVEGTKSVSTGEKTPQNRTQSHPSRQSTTKKKKEAALKRAKKGSKRSKKGPSASSSEESEDDVSLKTTTSDEKSENRKSDDIENEKSLDQKKAEGDGKKEALESNTDDREKGMSDVSSDDNMPLNMLSEMRHSVSNENYANAVNTKGNDSEKQTNRKINASPNLRKKKVQLIPGKTSPLSTRMKSSGRVLRTRGRHRSLSPSAEKKTLSLRKTLKRKSLNLQSEIKEVEYEEKSPQKGKDSDKASEKVKNTATNDVNDPETLSNSENKKNTDADGDKDVNCSTKIQKNNVTFSENLIDDTPRKTPDVNSAVGAFKISECQSDSKLVTVPRKFQRRLARRSILKISSNVDEEKSPNVNKHFHPIRVGQIFSPCASPSASILKRRRLIGDSPTNSPSPPSKQRRVSFAEPLTEEQMSDKNKTEEIKPQPLRPSSPLVINYTSSSTKTSLKFLSTKSKMTETNTTDSNAESQDSPMSPSLGSYHSTVEADLNATDPICPELVECSQSVEKVLPQLTSSMWARGLGQLVRSRNIRTIGDLSSMTEREIQNLPICSPKITTVRKALKTFVGQKEKKSKTNVADSEQSTDKETVNVEEASEPQESHTPPGTPGGSRHRVETESDELGVGPEMELDMSYCSPIKRTPDEELNTSIKEVIEGTEGLLDEVNRFTSDLSDKRSLSEEVGLLTNQSTPKSLFGKSNLRLQVSQGAPKPVLNNASGASQKNSEDFISCSGGSEFVSLPRDNLMNSPSKCSKGLVDSLQEVMDRCSAESLRQVKTEDLFELHRMSTTLTNQVMSILKTRCQPQDTQS